MKDIFTTEDKETIVIELGTMLENDCEYGENMDNLCDEEKVFYFVYVMEGEINSGGFGSFFRHSYGEYTRETLKALKVVGAEKTAKLFKKAMWKFPFGIVPVKYEVRQIIADFLDDREVWDKLEDAFYEEDYAEELLHAQYNYISKNKKIFMDSIDEQLKALRKKQS